LKVPKKSSPKSQEDGKKKGAIRTTSKAIHSPSVRVYKAERSSGGRAQSEHDVFREKIYKQSLKGKGSKLETLENADTVGEPA